MKKLLKIKTLKNKLDKTFNLYIRLRDKKCILSGKKDRLQCSHYYDYLQNPFLRWDEQNAHAMSNKIHFKHHHGKAPDYSHWMYKNYSLEEMERLYNDSKKDYISLDIKNAESELNKAKIKYNKSKTVSNKNLLKMKRNELLQIQIKFYIEKIKYFEDKIAIIKENVNTR